MAFRYDAKSYILNPLSFYEGFPCDTLKETAGLWNRRSIEAKLGVPLSEEDYISFVEPFKVLNRLGVIRASPNARRDCRTCKIYNIQDRNC